MATRSEPQRGDGGVGDFEHEPDAVLDGAAISVGAVVGAGLKELVEEVAVGTVNLHAIEAGCLRVLRAFAIGPDDSGNLARVERTRGDEWPFRTEQADVPAGCDGAGRDRERAVQIAGIGNATDVPELEEHLPAGGVHGVGDDSPALHLLR